MDDGRRRHTEEVEHGRHDVQEPRPSSNAPPRDELPREAEDERHTQRLGVQVVVPEVTMLGERLAMIGGEDDERVAGEAERVETTEQWR